MVKALVWNLNGISIAYIMALVNAALSMLLAFGLNLTIQEQASITAFVNAALVALAHISHRLGEAETALRVSPAQDVTTSNGSNT